MFKIFSYFNFIFVIIIGINIICLSYAELVFLQFIWRHGDRAPIHLYPTDPNSKDVWKRGLGQLTTLGRQQQFILGKLFRKNYDNFITTSPQELKVISSDCDRCMDSVETNLASFYAPKKTWKFESDFNWQPIPVRYIPKHDDRYLEDDSYCPEATKESERIIKSKEGQEIIKENWAMFQYLSNHSGRKIDSWDEASYLHDTVFIEKKYNLTIPSWTDTYWDQWSNVSTLSFYWSFMSPLMLRLRAGPLLGEIRDNMVKKISNKLPLQKVQIYSTHDTQVALLLQILQMYNMKSPPYCATIIVELHNINDSHHVRFLYFNSSTPESGEQTPHILTLKGCSEYCPFDFFVNYTQNLVPTDWEAECQIKPKFFVIDGKSVTAGVVFTILTFLITGVCSYILWKIHCRNKRDYSYHFLHSNINS